MDDKINNEIMAKNIEHLRNLFEAIINVNGKYIKYGEFDESIKEFETDKPLERVFTYELYHQWSLTKSPDLVLNGEIVKCTKEGKSKYPDFVLHKGQETDVEQAIVCEVKRFCVLSSESMIHDLEKLLLFTHSGNDNNSHTFGNPFAFGVFIVIGCSFATLRNFMSNTNIEKYKEIICIAYHEEGQLEYNKIGKICDQPNIYNCRNTSVCL